MMNKKNYTTSIDDLIAGYFAQELNDEQLAELQVWLKDSDENKAYFLQTQEVWFSAISANHAVRFDAERAYQRFLTSTIRITNEKSVQKSKPIHRIVSPVFFKVAAAIAILVVFTGAGYLLGEFGSKRNIGDVVVEAPLGSRTKMNLPDGTLVWLNAGSTLRYKQDFGIENRTVELVGEGYFEVTHNKQLNFDVKTNEVTVRVLGTKFNFRNYNDEDEARVTLLEGKVELCQSINSSENKILSPDEQAVLDKNSKNISVQKVDAIHASDWTQGYISFDEEKLANIVQELERLYNVKITISDEKLLEYRFYGNFTRTEQTIEDVLKVLVSTERLRFEQKGKEIILYGN